MKLDQTRPGFKGLISSIEGDAHLVSRVTSIGIVPGSEVEVLMNSSKQPMLLFLKDSMIALNKEDAGRIEVSEK